ncbi:aminoacyl-tRNA hydrolase [Ahrensia sp. AH-315-G08]|nr:aminoacyl-tRNA hydrolase [Ahrensia sp. AH-315-G08]
MLLIVGLGNPGQKFENHRHNVGFMAVDALHRHEGFDPWKSKFQGMISQGTLGGEKALLLKPATFMNDSGRSVGEAARFFKIEPKDVIVLYDELDLTAGKVRVKTGGGAGGHNGIRSIDAHLGKDYRRVRIGIGHPGQKERVSGHVLGDFAKSDYDWLGPLLEHIAANAHLFSVGDDSKFTNKLALAMGAGDKSEIKKPKAQSHIRQARAKQPKPPASGPMAAMLSKLLGDKKQ